MNEEQWDEARALEILNEEMMERVIIEVPPDIGVKFVGRGPKVIGFEFNTDTQVYEVMIEYSKDIIKIYPRYI